MAPVKLNICARSYFTLIEVLLVIALLVMAVSTLGIKGFSALQRHRFEASADQLVSKLNLAQHLMLCHHANARVCVDKNGGGQFVLALECDEELPPNWAAIVGQKRRLRGVDRIAFNGDDGSPLTLRFSRETGTRMPTGVITLTSPSEEQIHIPLPGHLTQISKCHGNLPTQAGELDLPSYPQEVAQALRPAT